MFSLIMEIFIWEMPGKFKKKTDLPKRHPFVFSLIMGNSFWEIPGQFKKKQTFKNAMWGNAF